MDANTLDTLAEKKKRNDNEYNRVVITKKES